MEKFKELQKLISTKNILERWFQEHDDNHPAMQDQKKFYNEICKKLKKAGIQEPILKQPFFSEKKVICGNCKGEGKVDNKTCQTCAGTGMLSRIITGEMELFRTNKS